MKNFLMNQPGDVWAVDLNREDKWFQKLDWQSQFEISRWSSTNLSEESLLYSSPKHFPNKMNLLINKKNPEDWVHCLYTKWAQIGRPLMVVFLPKRISKDVFLQNWQKQEPHILQVHLVEA